MVGSTSSKAKSPVQKKSTKEHRGVLANQRGIRPCNLASLLLAPTVIEILPSGFAHPWAAVSHMDRSYLDKLIVTVRLSFGESSMLVKPLSMEGGSPEDAGILT